MPTTNADTDRNPSFRRLLGVGASSHSDAFLGTGVLGSVVVLMSVQDVGPQLQEVYIHEKLWSLRLRPNEFHNIPQPNSLMGPRTEE